MAKLKKNPAHRNRRPFRYEKENGVRIPIKSVRGTLNKRERVEFLKHVEYMERVEKMRPYFGDLFKPKSGYNLHNVDTWTSAQKRKITNYFRIIAPRIEGGDFVVKRYRRKDHHEAAVRASLQEKPLKGQTAVLFSVAKGVDRVGIRFTKKRGAIVEQEGVATSRLLFNKRDFLTDWKGEVNRVLDIVPSIRIFKIIKGANLSSETYRREDIMREVAAIMELYTQELSEQEGFHARWFGEWLNGLVAYEGVTITQMKKADATHKGIVREREKVRNEQRRRLRKRIAGRRLKEQIEAERAARGKKLTRGELASGRKGRVK